MLKWCLFIALSATLITASGSEEEGEKKEEKVVYKFKEYQYKENTKNENAFREFETACEQTPACATLTGAGRVACVRDCISPSCHRELYGPDPLEEGEIDVRLNSFKGCFMQRLNRPRQ